MKRKRSEKPFRTLSPDELRQIRGGNDGAAGSADLVGIRMYVPTSVEVGDIKP